MTTSPDPTPSGRAHGDGSGPSTRAGRARTWLPLLALAVLLGLAGCGEAGESAGVETITVRDSVFAPAEIRVPVGTTVRFENEGRMPHDAVAEDGSWATPTLDGAEAATVTLTEPGIHGFYCSLHGSAGGRGMAGTIVVDGHAAAARPAAAPGAQAAASVTGAPSGVTRLVPDEHATIQEAVDASGPGDLVLIGPGVYPEEVEVSVPEVTLRGTDRDGVVIDGGRERYNGLVVTADGVAVENLTVRDALGNGVYWTGVTGYRASYVNAVDNQTYGLYAFDSVDGVFEHSYASGSYDAGFYIGQCRPCRAVVTNVVAENNALGYSGTNASGDLQIVESVWRDNAVGIVPNSSTTQEQPPFEDVTIVGNLVEANNNLDMVGQWWQRSIARNGIVLPGGNRTVVERNLVVDHVDHGVLVTPFPDDTGFFWGVTGNRVRDNTVRRSGRADIALSGPAGSDNCFEGNSVRTTGPPGLQALQPCEGFRAPVARWDLSTFMLTFGAFADYTANPDGADRGKAAVSPSLPGMPDATSAPARPAVGVYDDFEVATADLAVPEAGDTTSAVGTKELGMFGIPLFASAWQWLFALYGYLLPVVLYSVWTALAILDLSRQEDRSRRSKVVWLVVVLVIPFFGVIAYHVLGRPALPVWVRTGVIAGGLLAYLLVFATGTVLGGFV